MRVAFIGKYPIMLEYASIRDDLIKQGHASAIFAPLKSPEIVFSNWIDFDFKEIERFKPEVIVIFNGHGLDTIPAVRLLKQKYPAMHSELAWFPQKDHFYIDTNIQNLGNIAKVCRSLPQTDCEDGALIDLRSRYRSGTTERRERTILVPLQLEHDTSITNGSHLFKTMDSFVKYLSRELHDYKLLVRVHPKNRTRPQLRLPNVIYDNEPNLLNSISKCIAVVGLNSTSLMEARVMRKPVYQFGSNILCDETPMNLRDFIEELPIENYDNALCYLYNQQFTMKDTRNGISAICEFYSLNK